MKPPNEEAPQAPSNRGRQERPSALPDLQSISLLVLVAPMTDQEQLEVWQQLKAMGIPPEQRMQALDDQMRIDSLLRSFFAQVRRDEFEEQMRIVELEFPTCVTSTSDFSSPSSALSSSGV